MERADDSRDKHPATLVAWLNTHPLQEQRRFLEAHLELLSDRSEAMLTALMERYRGQRKAWRDLQAHLQLLQDARERGVTIQAVGEAYVNAYGGLTLPAPEWLEEVEQQLSELRAAGRQGGATRRLPHGQH